jgi:hypothetical protein
VDDEGISAFDLLYEQANKYLKYNSQGNLEATILVRIFTILLHRYGMFGIKQW